MSIIKSHPEIYTPTIAISLRVVVISDDNRVVAADVSEAIAYHVQLALNEIRILPQPGDTDSNEPLDIKAIFVDSLRVEGENG